MKVNIADPQAVRKYFETAKWGAQRMPLGDGSRQTSSVCPLCHASVPFYNQTPESDRITTKWRNGHADYHVTIAEILSNITTAEEAAAIQSILGTHEKP